MNEIDERICAKLDKLEKSLAALLKVVDEVGYDCFIEEVDQLFKKLIGNFTTDPEGFLVALVEGNPGAILGIEKLP